MRGVEREGPRRELGDADPARGTGEPRREEPVRAAVRVDDDDVVGEGKGELDRFGEPPLDAGLHDHAVDDDVDRVVLASVESEIVLERHEPPIDARLEEALGAPRREVLLELALPAPDDGRQDVEPFGRRLRHDEVDDARDGLRRDLAIARRTVRHADVREEQPQVVVDLGHRADGRARVLRRRLLFDGDRGREALDRIDIGLGHELQELARIGRQALDVAPLSLGVDRVEGEGRLPRPRQPRDHDQAVARQIDVDVLQVVFAGAANDDFRRHDLRMKRFDVSMGSVVRL